MCCNFCLASHVSAAQIINNPANIICTHPSISQLHCLPNIEFHRQTRRKHPIFLLRSYQGSRETVGYGLAHIFTKPVGLDCGPLISVLQITCRQSYLNVFSSFLCPSGRFCEHESHFSGLLFLAEVNQANKKMFMSSSLKKPIFLWALQLTNRSHDFLPILLHSQERTVAWLPANQPCIINF